MRPVWIGGALLLLTLLAYRGVLRCDFLHYDDDLFLTANPHVQRGLAWGSIRWAFEADLLYDSPYADYWTPLTVVSRLLDVQFFGMQPAPHHLTNLVLHGLNVVLLFGVLRALTGALFRSAFVAAILAVHPLHVESVAWLSERKDVLAGLFWILAMGAYVLYVRSPSPWRRAAVVAAFACGLMAKPMVMTLPFVLLLLDLWPLRRLDRGFALVREKWPLFALSAASVAITVTTTAGLGADLQGLPLGARAANAVDACASYLGHAFWPARLAVGYPHPGASLPVTRLAIGLMVLASITAGVVAARAARPYLLVGWLWFLGALVPVLGFVQVGVHSRADRYVYLPLIGASIAVAWWCAEWASRGKWHRLALGALGIGIVLTLGALTRRQVEYWRDDLTLFTHSVEAVPGNAIGYNGIAQALARKGDLAGAEHALREALRIRPDLVVVIRNLAFALTRTGRSDEAQRLVADALQASRGGGSLVRSELHVTLGLLLARQGRPEEAKTSYAEALRLNPANWVAQYNWGNVLAAQGRLQEAEARYTEARKRNPDDSGILNNLGLCLLLQGRLDEAVSLLSQGVKSYPSSPLLRTSLGRALTVAGRQAEATASLQEAIRLAPQSAEARVRLAEALSAQGMTAEAAAQYREAIRLDPTDAQARAALRNQDGAGPDAGKASPATR